MPLVQLNRLRSQLKALGLHFDDPDIFQESLTSLFLLYENQESTSNAWLKKFSNIPSYRVPESVISELKLELAEFGKNKPEAALINADILWLKSAYEYKISAITLISNLADEYQREFFSRINKWLSGDLAGLLVNDLLTAVKDKPKIINSKHWKDQIYNWINSTDLSMVRLGLVSLSATLVHMYQNLPSIFNMLLPIVQKNHISFQKDLIDVIRSLIAQSEAETASFLIMVGDLYSEKSVQVFLRKCIPLFSEFFQSEIRKSLTISQ